MRSDLVRGAGLTRRTLLQTLAFAAASPAFGHEGTPRVATLDYGVATTLLKIGITPVGVASAADWDVWVVEPELPAEVVDLGDDLEPNLELLAALRPDLIVSTPYLKPLEQALERIAPVLTVTIYAPDGGALARAEEATRRLGRRLDREAEADAFLERSGAVFERCRERLAGIGPGPIALVNFMDARHARVFGGPGLYQGVLDRIGIENAWPGPTNYWGFQTIGLEELSRVPEETRLVAFEPVPPDVRPTLAESPLWTSLPFVRADRVSTLPGVLMFGMVPSAVRFAELLTSHLEEVAA